MTKYCVECGNKLTNKGKKCNICQQQNKKYLISLTINLILLIFGINLKFLKYILYSISYILVTITYRDFPNKKIIKNIYWIETIILAWYIIFSLYVFI